MKEVYSLKTPEIKQNCIEFIQKLDDIGYTVTIKDEAESRSAAQLRLKWLWVGFLEKELVGVSVELEPGFYLTDLTGEQWNEIIKRKLMRSILRQQTMDYDKGFAQAEYVIKVVKSELFKNEERHEEKQRFLLETIVREYKSFETKWLSVTSMAAYMAAIQVYCATHKNIRLVLPVPDDLKWLNEK